ncbi:MAG: Unknown protein [uncultured Sulfurovum sp.]|uniref:LysM domain-containing protein n=1 Tax=uncultured Sulfurovum sp. TaxID=269237 RepID=A0A6S6TGA6_9BACT|nr:MAG: Unknown protein [uncultured Sulfurovum sp.]
MEVVKRLEGSSVDEEFDFELAEKEIEQKNTSKKPKFFTFIILFLVAIAAYLGFNQYQKSQEASLKIDESLIVVKEIDTSTTAHNPLSNNDKTEEPPKEELIVKAVEPEPKEEPTSEKQTETQKEEPTVEKQAVDNSTPKEVAVYTEVLAQNIILPQSPQQESQEVTTAKKETVPKAEIPQQAITKEATSEKAIPTKTPSEDSQFDVKITKVKVLEPKKEPISPKPVPKKVKPKASTPEKIVAQIITRKRRLVTIKKGDTLNLIAQRYYGSSMDFKRIIRANKSLKSSKSSLRVGQKIVVPYLPKQKRQRVVTIKKGYTLAKISKQFYGSTDGIQKIVNANRNIKNKNSTLRIGQKVYVPK